MNKRLVLAAAVLSIAGFASTAHAQIINRTFNVVGSSESNGSNHPSTLVSVSADVGLNTYTINFANTTIGPGGYVGTITSFGFNTPFTGAALGTDGSNVSFSSTKSGWGIFEPYDLSQAGGIFAQELGAGVGAQPDGGNPTDGIHFGESATFVFTFADFTSANGFFDSLTDFSVRWQQVGLSTIPEGQRGGSDFGGANDGGSTPGDLPNTPVPEPSTYSILGGILLLGFALKRRLQKRA
jgi:hypothetical protein